MLLFLKVEGFFFQSQEIHCIKDLIAIISKTKSHIMPICNHDMIARLKLAKVDGLWYNV